MVQELNGKNEYKKKDKASIVEKMAYLAQDEKSSIELIKMFE